MPLDTGRMLAAWKGLRVLVVGDLILDRYLHGTAAGLCREGPVPVLTVAEQIDVPGGAANTAANLAALGARVSLLSVIGNEAEGTVLTGLLAERGIEQDRVLVRSRRRTLTKTRVAAESQIITRIDVGSTAPLEPEDEEALCAHLTAAQHGCDLLVVSDYGAGVLTPRVIETLAAIQARAPRVLAVDSRDLARYRHARVTVAKPNFEEAVRLLGLPSDLDSSSRAEVIAGHARQLLETTGARIVAATIDREGSVIIDRAGTTARTAGRPVLASQTAGAGDCFISAFALALTAGAGTEDAATIASVAANAVVERPGTAVLTAQELHAALSVYHKQVPSIDDVAPVLEAVRRRGGRIVFTSGCFDILHRGHISLLERARRLGDILVVGVNSDRGVRRLKGPGRPLNTLEDRIQVLASLDCIDYVTAFEEDTPSTLIRAIRPDVFAKGDDHQVETLPEAALVEELGGAVVILPRLGTYSTSYLVSMVRGTGTHPSLQPVSGEVAV